MLMELGGKWVGASGHASRVEELLRACEKTTARLDGRVDAESSHVAEVAKDMIKLEQVDIQTPDGGLVLASQLSIMVNANTDKGMIITGPNGCGKSGVLRTIVGLWSPGGGTLLTPSAKELHYVPTKPYMPEGTLADLVTYPHRAGADETTLSRVEECLHHVHLSYLVPRQSEGLLTLDEDWENKLSLGEQQRIGMARLFFRSPPWALLDECTSAVALDGEESMYRHLRDEFH
ncbi:High-affinity zinc uptake system ATP-binding protein znuC, putative, partial [Perkinsus marinus ATCC 50983]